MHTSTHQPGQADFKSILPEDIDWKPFCRVPALGASVRRCRLTCGAWPLRDQSQGALRRVKLMPHRHPEDRVYTVISGVFYIGLGEQFEGDKLKAYPLGGVVVLPGDTSHFHWAKSGE